MLAVLTLLCLLPLSTGCRDRVITKREAILPERAYLRFCEPDYGQQSTRDVILGLTGLVGCERADKCAIQAWAANYDESYLTDACRELLEPIKKPAG